MTAKEIIRGRRVLIVDDERDVLDTMIELLDLCKIDTAENFEKAKEQLENNIYDVVILDIMGVRGFDLLKIANELGVPSIMFTAHAFSEDTLIKAAKEDANYYVPKEKMDQIEIFLADVIESVEKKKNPWVKCFERLGNFYDQRFGGTDWREKEKNFWEKKIRNELS